MTLMKIGCQTITWGDDQYKWFPRMFSEIERAGFQGVEIGWRRLAEVDADEMKQLLAEHNLKLVGTHIGGNLADTSQAKGEWGMLNSIMDYLKKCDSSLLMFSGLRYEDDTQFEKDLELLVGAAAHCRDNGIELLYHNHDWEFANDQYIFNRLYEKKAIKFCPDLGWIYRAGEDVVSTLRIIKDRIGAVHAKDVIDGEEFKAVPLGTGMAPLAEGLEWIKENIEKSLWVISEQDHAEASTEEIARINGKFLERIIA